VETHCSTSEWVTGFEGPQECPMELPPFLGKRVDYTDLKQLSPVHSKLARRSAKRYKPLGRQRGVPEYTITVAFPLSGCARSW